MMVYLQKERFPVKPYNKLNQWKIGPFKIYGRSMTMRIILSFFRGTISLIVNVANLFDYVGDEEPALA